MATHICLECGWKGDSFDIADHYATSPKCKGKIVKIGGKDYP